jgi:hypothetical protein
MGMKFLWKSIQKQSTTFQKRVRIEKIAAGFRRLRKRSLFRYAEFPNSQQAVELERFFILSWISFMSPQTPKGELFTTLKLNQPAGRQTQN